MSRQVFGTLYNRVLASLRRVGRPRTPKYSPQSRGHTMTFRPLHDRVLIRRIEAKEKTAGGIIIPDTAQEKPQEGEVVSVGIGARGDDGTNTPLDVKAG